MHNDTTHAIRTRAERVAACLLLLALCGWGSGVARAQDPLEPAPLPPPPLDPPEPAPLAPPPLKTPKAGKPVMPGTMAGRKIGVVLPLSGPHKRLGQVVLDALTLARVDLDGPELQVEDSRGREEEARAAVTRLASDPSVVAVLGPLGWKESRAAAEQAQEVGVPLVSFSAEHGLEQLGEWVFRARPSMEEEAKAAGEFALKDLQVERYAILHPDDVLGTAAAEVFYEVIRQGGARVTGMSAYKTDDTNLMWAVEELVGKRGPRLAGRSLAKAPQTRSRPMGGGRDSWVNFHAVFVPDYGDTVALLTRFMQFHDIGLAGMGDGPSVQIIGVGLLPSPQLANADGLVSGALYPELFDVTSDHPGVPELAARYRESFGRDMSDVEAHAYDMYRLMLEALVPREGPSRRFEPGAEERRALTRRMVEVEPIMGLTGLRWWRPGGAPGHKFEIWVVDSAGQVSLALP